jgi:hypothetical protein
VTAEPPTVHGRVIITWPAPEAPGQRAHVVGWGIAVHDADTGEAYVDTLAMSIGHGTPSSWDTGPVHVTLTRLIAEDGMPIGLGKRSPTARTPEYLEHLRTAPTGDSFDGQHYRTADFRYLVAEMRVAESSHIPTRRSVNEGRHTIEEFRAYYDLTRVAELADAVGGDWSHD